MQGSWPRSQAPYCYNLMPQFLVPQYCLKNPGLPCTPSSREAILARSEPGTKVAFWPPVSTCPAWGLCRAPSHCPGPVRACLTPWRPAYQNMDLLPLWSLCPVHTASFCNLHSLCVTGLGLVPCAGSWDPLEWPPTEDDDNTVRHQKRSRTTFNLEQVQELEKVFAKQHSVVGKKRAQLAAQLNLTENQVKVWFQNRRVKYYKELKLQAISACLDEPSSSSDATVQSEDIQARVDN